MSAYYHSGELNNLVRVIRIILFFARRLEVDDDQVVHLILVRVPILWLSLDPNTCECLIELVANIGTAHFI